MENNINLYLYSEAIHLFEPWNPPALMPESQLQDTIEVAIQQLEGLISAKKCNIAKEMFRYRKDIFRILYEVWKPQPGTELFETTTRILYRMWRPPQALAPDTPPVSVVYKTSPPSSLQTDACVGSVLFNRRLCSFEAENAGPQARLDLQTIGKCIGRALHPGEAVAMRGYCLASKYLILACPPENDEAKPVELFLEQARLYFENIFNVAGKLGCKSIVLSPIRKNAVKEALIEIMFSCIKQAFATLPALEHVVICTRQKKMVEIYREYATQLQEVR